LVVKITGVTTMQHEDYDISTHVFDIAIIRLPEEEKLRFNERVKPVCLPSKAAAAEARCVVTGWGRTSGKRHTTSIIILHTSFVADSIVTKQSWIADFSHGA